MTTTNPCSTCAHEHGGWCCRWTEPMPRLVPTDFQTIPFARADDERRPAPLWRRMLRPFGWQQSCGPSARYWTAKDAEAAPTPATPDDATNQEVAA